MSREEGRKRLAGRGVKVAVPTVAALGAGSALAVGAIPGDDGTIQGCYSRVSGTLRVVENKDECRSLETAIGWNERGPAGPQGVPGPQGPPGPAGDAATIIVGGEALTAGTADAFLKVDGIEGESSDSKHKGSIELESFAFGVKQTGATGGGAGGGAGKAEFSSFRIAKLYDASSPKLFHATAAGTHLKSAQVTFRRRGDNPIEFLTYKFEDVLVDAYDQGGYKEQPLLEGVGFAFGKVTIEYRRQKPDGSLDSPIVASWDTKANK